MTEQGTPPFAERYDALPDPIFVGGSMRSGTSFVMKLLQGHPHMTGLKMDADLLGPILRAWMPEGRHHDPYTGVMALVKRDEAQLRRFVRANWFFVYEYAGRPVFTKRLVEKTPDSQAMFRTACEVFPNASLVIVIREPIGSVRSALAHALLFYPNQSLNLEATIERVTEEWTQSMQQTLGVLNWLGNRILLVNFDEFLTDVQAHAASLLEWCGADAQESVVAKAVAFAGSPGDERAYWQRILDWPEDEFAWRYGAQLNPTQQQWVQGRTRSLYEEVEARRVQAGRST